MDEYISKEELIEHLDKCRNDPLFDPEMARMCGAISILIKNMPAADVQPVRHGKRVGKAVKLRSVCKHNSYWDEWGQLLFDFCPDCGEKMDGDTE